MKNLSDIRKEYRDARLDADQLNDDPFRQFSKWLEEALTAGVNEPTAMALSTVSSACRPSSRMVLLKDMDDRGFTFFTNYESKKGLELSENPYAALLFFWPELERQVRIEGRVTRIVIGKSDLYFRSRPEGSKVSAWASPQSRPVPSRQYLESLHRDYAMLFRSREPERPQSWGGYILFPVLFEFWQGRENRLHDRFEYSLKGRIWEIQRLAP